MPSAWNALDLPLCLATRGAASLKSPSLHVQCLSSRGPQPPPPASPIADSITQHRGCWHPPWPRSGPRAGPRSTFSLGTGQAPGKDWFRGAREPGTWSLGAAWGGRCCPGSHRPFGVTAGGSGETDCWARPSGQGGQEHQGVEGFQRAGPQVPPLKADAQPRPPLPDSKNLRGSG